MSEELQMSIPGLPAPARPTEQDRSVIAATVDRSRKEITEWLCGGGYDIPDEEVDLHMRDIECAFLEHNDGYNMARHLEERHGWTPDADLVEILNGLDTYYSLNEATKAWVSANNIKPRFAVGDEVLFYTSRRGAAPYGDFLHGRIVRVEGENGTYVIKPVASEKNNARFGKGGGWIVWFEHTYSMMTDDDCAPR